MQAGEFCRFDAPLTATVFLVGFVVVPVAPQPSQLSMMLGWRDCVLCLFLWTWFSNFMPLG